MSLYAEKAHKRIARMVGYALTLGTYEAWAGASVVIRAHLTAEERAALAWSALNALDTHEAELVLDALRKGRAE